MNEFDLFMPIQRYFEDLGYRVNAEVKHCDITAVKDDELIIVEMKKTLSVQLLSQALSRQKLGADSVYIAVPKPKHYKPRSYKDIFYLLKKLELGLIFVNLIDGNSFAEVALDPAPFNGVRVNRKKNAALLKEINSRSVEMNKGGISKRKIITAYTERCIHIACILTKYGEMSAARLSGEFGLERKEVYNAFRGNPFGWFYKVEKGIYALTLKGKKDLADYPELVMFYKQRIQN